MTFVLNKCYGGFGLSDFACEHLGLEAEWDYDYRDNLMVDALASLITEFGSEKCSGDFARLQVVTIPDEATDFEVNEYDGIEELTYVINGKLHHA